MVEAAKKAEVPVIGANFPRPLRMGFAMKGAKALDELTPEQRQLIPEQILPAPDEYWERLSRQLRDHGHGGMPTSEEQRLYSVQNLWDNSMADAAITARPEDGLVMHVAGAFHIEYGLGTTAQIKARRPEAKIRTVTIVAVDDLSRVDASGDTDRADYIVYVRARARGLNDGALAVTVSTELEYLFSDPAASKPGRPLLVWLAEDGVRIDDELSYWTHALGDDALVAVVVPPYRQEERDLRIAGRWSWPDSHDGDVSRVVTGVGRIVDYVVANFGADARRVVVAGAGAGGNVALWAGLYGGDEDAPPNIVAALPGDMTRFSEASLPRDTPELASVAIVATADARKGAEQTLREAGVEALRGVEPGTSPEETWRRAEAEIRKGLGLGPGPVANGEPVTIKVAADTALARQWARMYSRANPGTRFETHFGPEAKGREMDLIPTRFAEGKYLPLSPGAFGGTTVLVVPDTLTPERREQWMKLGTDDVLNKRNRFHHLAVTDTAGLPKTLADIKAAGRRNVLIVPAQFVAAPARMEALQQAVEGHDPSLSIHWLPGLGSALVEAIVAGE
jgi:poly(3-hydroxybutyrate) depolymerase